MSEKAESRGFEARLRDPLSDLARKHRTFLLISSFIGIVMAKTGIVPSKIAAFGIEFGAVDTQALLFITAAIVIYFLAAFLLYSATDFLAWRHEILKALEDEDKIVFEFREIEKDQSNVRKEEMPQEEIELQQQIEKDQSNVRKEEMPQEEIELQQQQLEIELRRKVELLQDEIKQMNKVISRIKRWEIASVPASVSRALFEFVVPIVIAIYVVAVLFTTDVSNATLPNLGIRPTR